MNIANKLTILRMGMVPIFIISMLVWGLDSIIPFVVFSIAAFTDFLDGYLARKYDLVTVFGKFLDPVADKLLTLSAFIMLIEFASLPAWGVCIIVAREVAITGFRIIAASSGVTIAASVFGKIKTITQFLSIIFLLLGLSLGRYIFYLAVLFTLISGIEYLIRNKEVLDLDNI